MSAQPTPTFCEACDHVHPESRKRVPSQWLCVKFPRLEGYGFVAPNVWAAMEPFNDVGHQAGRSQIQTVQ